MAKACRSLKNFQQKLVARAAFFFFVQNQRGESFKRCHRKMLKPKDP